MLNVPISVGLLLGISCKELAYLTFRIQNGTSVSAASMQSELVAASSDGLLSVFNMSRGIVLKEVIIDFDE